MNDNDESPAGPRRKRLRSSQRHEKDDQHPPRRTRLVSHAPAPAPTSQEGLQRFKELLEAAMDGRGVSEEFLSQSLAMYKTWKRSGAPYDEFCFACKKSDDIHPCLTCRRQYHESCRPKGSITVLGGLAQGWYCDICVVRNWHMKPPTLTPPASPPPETSRAAEEVESGRRDVHPTNPPPQSETMQSSHGLQDPSPNLRLIQSTPTSYPTASQNTSQASETAIAHPATTPSHTGPGNVPVPQTRSTDIHAYTTYRPAVTRRSRYTTLPTEVDSALRVLYSELETAAELRQQIGGLEGQVIQLRQDLSLRDRELQMTQKALQSARASQSELAQLRQEASQRQGSMEEATTLRAEKQQLEEELKSTRTQMDEMSKTLQQWKQKLSALIAD
ncbi:unnamed protein product [Clonostachys solani]|uniref:PHD-type domain-containing protein n=1 Tax=Clonostachys solani TaxID=160281 RepID=A0A9N9ZE03_9HYPO|nr:unnamed protein product [Clonostachys solani]